MSASADPTPKEQKKVKWGIVGLGDVCATKSGPAFWKCNGSELVAVMRRTPNTAKEWVIKNVPGGEDVCQGYDNIDQFLNHPGGLDAIYISTPPGTHLEIAKKIANSSVVACYVEKPVGRCASETEEMVQLFQTKNKLFFPAYISRAYDRTNTVKQMIQDGAIGDTITSVTYTLKGTGGIRGIDSSDDLPWRLNAIQSGGGLIMDVGCHVIDRIDYLLGPLINVKGKALNRNNSPFYNVEDYVELQAEIGPSSSLQDSTSSTVHSVDATVHFTWDFTVEKEEETCDELIITGSNGSSLRMAAMSPSLPVNHVNDSNNEIIKTLKFESPEHTAQPLIQIITDEIRGADGESVVSPARGDNAIRTSKVLDTILGSYYGGRSDEFWLRSQTWPGKPTKM